MGGGPIIITVRKREGRMLVLPCLFLPTNVFILEKRTYLALEHTASVLDQAKQTAEAVPRPSRDIVAEVSEPASFVAVGKVARQQVRKEGTARKKHKGIE